MGFNTVAFLLNDFFHCVEEAPKGVAWLLTHPPMGRHDEGRLQVARDVSSLYGEKPIHPQAVEVLPTFHADDRRFFTAGGNCISELRLLRVRKDRKTGRKVAVLELPDYLQGFK